MEQNNEILNEIVMSAEDLLEDNSTDVEVVLGKLEDKCPYEQYHRDCSEPISCCSSWKLAMSSVLEGKEPQTIVGLWRKSAEYSPTKRALVLIVKLMRQACSRAAAAALESSKIKFNEPDFNLTYESDVWKIAVYLTKTLSEILTHSYSGPVYVSPPTAKQYDQNIVSLMRVTRSTSFDDVTKATCSRTIFYLPVYVILMHSNGSPAMNKFVNEEMLKFGPSKANETLDVFFSLLQHAQFKHYTSRLKILKDSKIPTDLKFYAAMDYGVEQSLRELYQ